MTKEQTNSWGDELNGKEMPLVSTFSLQELIDKAVSQEKEKMIEEIKKEKVEKYSNKYPDAWLDCCGAGETDGYNKAIDDIINLLQNK